MIKKLIFNIITVVLYIITTVAYSLQVGFEPSFSLVILFLLCIFSFSFWKPDAMFRFTHWYLGRELEQCSDVFIFLYKAAITVMLFITGIISLWEMAPFEI